MMSEFWAPGNASDPVRVKRVASVAHTLGKPLVAAEAFTGTPVNSRWLWTPATLKPIGDQAFANGLNQAVLHSYVHQPRSDTPPGFTLGRYGTHFGRLVTWWTQAAPWISYLSRTQFLLQSGAPVNDVLVLRTEEDDSLRSVPYPSLPPGYSFDWVAPAQLLSATMKDRSLILAGAQAYRVLLLPDLWTADRKLLEQLGRLAAAGVPVFGNKPVAPTSVHDVQAQAEWQQAVDRLWGQPGTPALIHSRQAMTTTLQASVQPDVTFSMTDNKAAPPLWTHRHTSEGELYFVSNPTAVPVAFTASFRNGERQPELWNAVSGTWGKAFTFRRTPEGMQVPLELPPNGSVFVIFRSPAPARWLTKVTAASGEELPAQPSAQRVRISNSGKYKLTWSDGSSTVTDVMLPTSVDVSTDWTVQLQPPLRPAFERTFSRLHDLALDPDPSLKYFAGTMLYRKRFSLTQAQLAGKGCTLSLGTVQDIASVHLNGHDLGTVWTAPFEADSTAWLRPGENSLEIEIANRWVNRLIGDEALPPDTEYRMDGSDFNRGRLAALPSWYGDSRLTAQRERSTFASWKHYTRDSPLVPSGLIGPVMLTFYRDLPLTAPSTAKKSEDQPNDKGSHD